MKQFLVASRTALIFIFVLILATSCSLISGGNTDQVSQTLVALAFTQTAMVSSPVDQAAAAPTITPMISVDTTAESLTHVIMPGEPPATESTIDDILFNSDNFNSGVYERPYTMVEMVYHPDLDLQKIMLSADNTFFFVDLPVFGVNGNTQNLVANYGAEFDTDKDGRGDYLLWVYQAPTSTSWDITGVALFTDLNNDVGSVKPLLSDTPTTTDGYETELWPGKPITDPDGAWVRIDPSNPAEIQIAVKRSLLGNPTELLWSGWADDNLKAAYLFDYNDSMTAQEAGSPYASNAYYPIGKLALVDNTCRGAWGFKPTGNEPGICKTTTQPTTAATKKPGGPTNTVTIITPTATKKPVITTAPCTDVQITAQATAGGTWDPTWSAGVTFCLDGGDCKSPDSSGYAVWYRVPGSYTITGSSSYGITPSSGTVNLGCGEKDLVIFNVGPG
jgi:hypothetical protein